MEGESSASVSESQLLKTKLTKLVEEVETQEKYDRSMECIYRVPQEVRENNPKAYTPRIVSIGPFHKVREVGKEENPLQFMEVVKVKYLKGFLNRTLVSVGDFVVTLKKLEERIRSCYALPIEYNSDDFLEMILIDAAFIIELFLKICCKDWKHDDPLLSKSWMLDNVEYDLILLENQLPFFVLDELYNLTGLREKLRSFLEISTMFFGDLGFGTVCPRESPKHFTDLLRSIAISSSKLDLGALKEYKTIKHVYSASQLMEAGLKFKVSSDQGLLNLVYSDEGVFTMPILNLYGNTQVYFRNMMAFEFCHRLDTYFITQFIIILAYLLDTEKDVKVLIDNKIVVNLMGDDKEVSSTIKYLTSGTPMPPFNSQYVSLCNNLNDFYENPLNKYKAILKHEYFSTPVKIASTVAAILLLFLTFIQTVCSIISVVQSKKS